MAYTLLETYTVPSGGASSIEFDPIEGVDGADLKVLISARSNASGAATEYRFQFNGDTSSVYYTKGFAGDGSGTNPRSVGPTSFLENLSLQKNGSTANTFGNAELYISNFSSAQDTTASFMAVSENNATEAYQGIASFYRDVAEAITSIKIYATVGDFMEHSTASLYLVTTADASGATGSFVTPPKATGGTITSAGGYWIHTFTSSGTFTPTESLTCDFLVIAGGGSGYSATGSGGVGGGGAGGLRSSVSPTGGGGSAETSLSLSATGYTVTVGAGGASSSDSSSNGSNSVFGTLITSTGGGGGGAGNTTGSSGGSGGGAGETYGGTVSGGARTVGEGYAGGDSVTSAIGAGGGGGGAVGTNTSATFAGNGGAGVANVISGSSTFYAGGGGGAAYPTSSTGGLGGSGGGGNGTLRSVRSVATAGTSNTGGGGGALGGSAGSSGSTAGGSGIVIVRYAA